MRKIAYLLKFELKPNSCDDLIVFARSEEAAKKKGYDYYQKRDIWFGIKIVSVVKY